MCRSLVLLEKLARTVSETPKPPLVLPWEPQGTAITVRKLVRSMGVHGWLSDSFVKAILEPPNNESSSLS